MSSRLKRGMYINGSTLFGLANGQMRTYCTVKNAGWYNHLGEKLGNGCLSAGDIKMIEGSLREGEVFVILSELESTFDVPKGMNPEHLDGEYMRNRARFVIHPGLTTTRVWHLAARVEGAWLVDEYSL